jgi:GWxTD domain-containing protein
VEVGTMNISSLRSGTYVFRASVVDSARGGVLASREKKFYVYKPGARPDSSSMSGGRLSIAAMEYYSMSDSAVAEEFSMAGYLATEPERQQFLRLTDIRAKQNFLYEFWQRRNTDTLAAVNTFRDQYLQRVAYANQNYMTGFRRGWKSDRGRIYVLYGPPSEVERNSSSQESQPYEVWNYNEVEGGVVFVFVDRTNSGDYQLVHSTMRTELHDESWYDHYARRTQ